MEKKGEPSSVVMGYEDSQSTYSIDQPPPAYKKPEAPSVKIAKLIAATVLALSLVIGGVVLGAVYIQTKNQCILIPQTVAVDTLSAAESAPVAEALLQAPMTTDAPADSLEESSGDSERLHIPLHLDIDDFTGQMMENNQRARMNCLIEKKKAEEIVTQTPKHLRTPFGNLTTDHRYVHVTGETMSLTCRSGNARTLRPIPMETRQQAEDNHIQSRMHMQPQMQPQMQMRMQLPNQHQPQQQIQHPLMAGPPHMLMGPGGPMAPPPALIMDLHGFREPRSDHPRAKRRVKLYDCACKY